MSGKTDSLRELYREVTDETVLTESQEETSTRDPLGEEELEVEREVSAVATMDGLGDALEGAQEIVETDASA